MIFCPSIYITSSLGINKVHPSYRNKSEMGEGAFQFPRVIEGGVRASPPPPTALPTSNGNW